MAKYPKTPLPVFYCKNWQYTHRSEWRRLAVPCGRAGSASNMHYDQDIMASVTVCKKKSARPVPCRDRFLGMLILYGKTRVNRTAEGK